MRWEAAPGAHPVLSGGRTIAGWSLADPSHDIWSASVPADLATRQLYVNGVRADVARSASGLPSGSTVTATGYTVPGASLQSVRDPADLQFVYHPLNWVQESCDAASITGDATQTIVTMRQPCWDTVQSFYGGTERADLPEHFADDYAYLTQRNSGTSTRPHTGSTTSRAPGRTCPPRPRSSPRPAGRPGTTRPTAARRS
ncbi:MAG TPA: hypothetical protein VFG87_11030 [Amycolatopsis sp.]|nr:hypothetical protein [Amycolatopsis sp.]